MRSTFRYQDFVDEQRRGLIHGVFIDDTGFPGLRKTPTTLHPDRKSWVAVIADRNKISEVWDQLPRAIDELRSWTGATEFHFTDAYAGRRQFKKIPLQQRLALFKFMAYIFSLYQFPIFVQTLDPTSLADFRKKVAFPSALGPFNLNRPRDLSLLLLIICVKIFLQETYPDMNRRTRLFVDEGFQRNGAAIVFPNLDTVFADGLICFGRSDSILPLQLADFAAFCINRTQLLLGRPSLSDLDKSFLEIIQPVAINAQNIVRLTLDQWFPDSEPKLH